MRIPLLAAFVAAALALPSAQASQVDLHLSSADDECIFRTDSNGLTPKIGSGATAGALAASGEFLAECAGHGTQPPPSAAQIELDVSSSYAGDSSAPLALTWRASADHCELALPTNWSGTPSQLCSTAQTCFEGGTADLTTTAGEGSYEVGLTCNRTGGTPVTKKKTVQVTVEDEEPPLPPGCPAQNLERLTTGTVTYRPRLPLYNRDVRYFQTTLGTPPPPSSEPVKGWPHYLGNETTFTVPRGKYIALEFIVPAAKPGKAISGSMNFVDSGMDPGSGLSGTIAYSECPGDFGQAGTVITKPSCKKDNIPFSDLGSIMAQTATTGVPTCYLQPGKKYYLNLLANCPAGNATCSYTIASNLDEIDYLSAALGIEVLDMLGW